MENSALWLMFQCAFDSQVNSQSDNEASWSSFFWISICSRSEPGWYHAIKMTTQFVFAQVSLLIILIAAITSMWLTVGESLRWIPFGGMIIMMHVVRFRDKQHTIISEEKEKTGPSGCAKIKILDIIWTITAQKRYEEDSLGRNTAWSKSYRQPHLQ